MMETAYEQHKPMLTALARLTTRRLGLKYNEALSLIHEIFVVAYTSWDGRTPLGQRIRYCILNQTTNELDRWNAKKRGAAVTQFLRDKDVVASSERFDLSRFAAELSEDAKDVVFLALDLPPIRTKRTPDSLRKRLVKILSSKGWVVRRISETFNEIAEALQ